MSSSFFRVIRQDLNETFYPRDCIYRDRYVAMVALFRFERESGKLSEPAILGPHREYAREFARHINLARSLLSFRYFVVSLVRISLANRARGAYTKRTRRWTIQQGDCHLKRSGEQRPPLPLREWSLWRDGERTHRELLPCLAILFPLLSLFLSESPAYVCPMYVYTSSIFIRMMFWCDIDKKENNELFLLLDYTWLT